MRFYNIFNEILLKFQHKIKLIFMKNILLFFCFIIGLGFQAQNLSGYSTKDSEEQLKLEQNFRLQIDSSRFKEHLKTLTTNPHVAGTAANEKVKDYIAKTMKNAGLEVKTYPYEIYMANNPGESKIEIRSPVNLVLDQKEKPLKEDKYSDHPELTKAWNAFSGSGSVTSEVVYANYGSKSDFEKLKELGVDVKDKIVIARYGKNFRGYKAKFAEASGAAGLIIYTDPIDSGFTKGLIFPEGPYYNHSAIQRGSLLTLDWTGDPLTPNTPALPKADKNTPQRLNPDEVGLHTIPVTPISYGAANHIFKHMRGNAVPKGWQGGLPYTYRLEGGKDFKIRLKVNQPKKLTKVYNVVGEIKGEKFPDEWIILGCHYDAWAFGATDPNSGTAMLLSLAETLGKMTKAGQKPDRSILIAHWDAEEHGVIGSSEWVEQFKDELMAKAVAYINLDGAASGKTFRASSSPSLKTILAESTKQVSYPYSNQTVFEHWSKGKSKPNIGNLGGGSDHIAFYMHAGIPSLNAGYSGTTLYHTNYDDFYFYEKFVDPEFKIGSGLEAIIGTLSLRMANATLLPYDLVKYATDLKLHFENVEKQILSYYPEFDGFKKSKKAINKLEQTSKLASEIISMHLQDKKISNRKIKKLNQKLLTLEKSFLIPEGLPFGEWYKSIYVSSDPFSGYASWILPGIQFQIETKNTSKLDYWDNKYASVIKRLDDRINEVLNFDF